MSARGDYPADDARSVGTPRTGRTVLPPLRRQRQTNTQSADEGYATPEDSPRPDVQRKKKKRSQSRSNRIVVSESSETAAESRSEMSRRDKKKKSKRPPESESETANEDTESELVTDESGDLTARSNQSKTTESKKKKTPRRRNTTFQENAITGGFTRADKMRKKKESAEKVEEEITEGTAFQRFTDRASAVSAVIYHYSQGMLGGLCLGSVFFKYIHLSSLTSDSQLLDAYSPIAAISQRAFYLLTTLSLLGAIDQLIRQRMLGYKLCFGGIGQKILVWGTLVAYTICYVSTVANSRTDDFIYWQNQSSPGWYNNGEIPHWFERDLKIWRVFDGIRLFTGIIAYLLTSLESHQNALTMLTRVKPDSAGYSSMEMEDKEPSQETQIKVASDTEEQEKDKGTEKEKEKSKDRDKDKKKDGERSQKSERPPAPISPRVNNFTPRGGRETPNMSAGYHSGMNSKMHSSAPSPRDKEG
ncbi:hypothetical protein PROFUN_00120 [Planoprotostelium fungivorum]|uniref:Transmembrane protein n=1 Tax=Planoprotostelium fungivorum TaxID=1890364 RepID=A0A2P6P0R2_9EUKA|nr:hypothetical protein PROFUN_00120 [Planoprotostelium fungivorum]